jgi:periplasmic protein CpxP/Spy
MGRTNHLSKLWRWLTGRPEWVIRKVSYMNGCGLAILLIALTGTALAGETRVDSARVDHRLTRLQQELKLTTDQTSRVRGILLAAEELKAIDRDRYKENHEALTEAARQRTARVDEQIKEVLTDEQKPVYESFRQRDEKEPWREMAQELEERLNLTTEQTARVNTILAAQSGQMMQMRSEGGGKRGPRGENQGRMSDMRKLRDDTDKKIEAVLTDDQKKEFEKYRKERQDDKKQDFGGQDRDPRGF